MHSSSLENLSEFIPSFEKQFIFDVHKMLQWGYEDAKKNIDSNTPEEHITGYIGNRIEDILDQEAERFKQGKYYHLDEENPVRDNPALKGKKRQRNDLRFVFALNQPRAKFIFEAKRLKSKSHELRLYTGKDGLQRFTRGDYAKRCSYAGMLGYVQTDDLNHWSRQLQNSFKKGFNENKLTQIKIIEEISHEYFSQHKRSSIGKDILIFHILLDFGG